MKIVRFLGPTQFLTIEGKRIARGGEDTVSDGAAKRLKKSKQVDVEIFNVEVRNLSKPGVGSRPIGSRSPSPSQAQGSATPQATATAAAEHEEKEK